MSELEAMFWRENTRRKKANNIIQIIDNRLGEPCDGDWDTRADAVVELTETFWEEFAKETGINKPSIETRQLVIDIYRARAAAERAQPLDPFEGLAS